MGGHRYYTFTQGSVQFFVMDTTYMDRGQLEWLEQSLRESRARWKVAYGHHPFYSSGKKHGSEVDLRQLVEPLFIKYGVHAVFAGHEHFYQRITPQNGIAYFISGAASKLRRRNIKNDPLNAAGFDDDLSFMLIEIAADTLYFEVISRTGATVDQGRVDRPADH
jgi:3',5'-cyclic AMP phosphodiesterase CpdA